MANKMKKSFVQTNGLPKYWFWLGTSIPPLSLVYNAKIFFSKTKVGRRNPHFVLKIDLCIAVRKMLYSGTIKYRREPLTCNRYIDYTVHQKTTTSQWRYSLKENTQSTTTATFWYIHKRIKTVEQKCCLSLLLLPVDFII